MLKKHTKLVVIKHPICPYNQGVKATLLSIKDTHETFVCLNGESLELFYDCIVKTEAGTETTARLEWFKEDK